MVQNTYTEPLPAVSLPLPAFAVQVAPVVGRIVAFLGSRAKVCSLPLSTTSTVSPLELAPADKQGNRAHSTFTKAQVVAIAREVVAIMSERPSPADVRGRVPSYWLGSKARNSDLAKALTLTYTPSKGNNADVELNAAGHCVAAFRRDVKRLNKANKLASTLKAGDGFFGNADAVVKANLRQGKGIRGKFNDQVRAALNDKNGNPRPYTSEKKAIKAVCRAIYGGEWFSTDKANRLVVAAKFVYSQADSVGKADQGRVTRAAAASLDDLSPAAVRALAKKAGAPKRVHTGSGSTARSRQWFSDDITRLEGVMTPQ
tara:strand:+ start:265 stop:1209 length:945 start_codon:yes stop_codon:yes gene_type:complete